MPDIVFKPRFAPVGTEVPSVAPRETWEQICYKYGTRLNPWDILVSASQESTIYTCPEGKVFLLIHAGISANGDAEESFSLWLYRVGGSNRPILRVRLENALTHGNETFAPALPLLLTPGERLHAINGGDITSDMDVSAYGYEIDKALFDKLI